MRWGELVGLDVIQLGGVAGMREHKIRVDRVVNEINGRFSPKPSTKNGRDRHVWYTDEVGEMLGRHLFKYGTERDELGVLVFRPRSLGMPLGRGPALSRGSWTRLILKPAVAQVFGCTLADKATRRYAHDECSCGGFTEHDLRHTYASLLLQSGQVTLHELMLLMGHSDYGQTLKYAHLVPDAGAVSRSALERPRKVAREETGTHGRQRPMPGVQHDPEAGAQEGNPFT
jgi:integrase